MKWNDSLGKGILKWSHCNDETLRSLALACANNHTRLALRLLDEINVEECALQNHPFHVLETAIESGDEVHALAVARHPRIRLGFDDTRVKNYKGYCGPVLKYTVYTCTESAVKHRMARVVQMLDELNHRRVCKAAWYATHEMLNEGCEKIPPAILSIAEKFLADWRWSKFKYFLLVRHHSDAAPALCLVHLPDPIFRHVMEFVKLSEFDKQNCCGGLEEFWMDYQWHTYRPTTNDYYPI